MRKLLRAGKECRPQEEALDVSRRPVHRYPGNTMTMTSAEVGVRGEPYVTAANTLDFWRSESLRSDGRQVTHHFPRGPHEVGPCRDCCHCCSACSGRELTAASGPALYQVMGLLGMLVDALRALGIRTCVRGLCHSLDLQQALCWGNAIAQQRPEIPMVPYTPVKKEKKPDKLCGHFSHHEPCRIGKPELLALKQPKETTYSERLQIKQKKKKALRRLGETTYEEIVAKYRRRECRNPVSLFEYVCRIIILIGRIIILSGVIIIAARKMYNYISQ